MSPLPPLNQGNRFQRWYAAWAAPHYLRMPPEARESAELIDRFLYSRRGLGVWIGLACAVAGSSAGLHGAGMPWWLAILLSALIWFVIPLIGLSAWLMPDRVIGRKPLKKYLLGAAFGALGAFLGFAIGHVLKRGRLDWTDLADQLMRSLGTILPVVLLVVSGMAFLMFGIAHIRRGILQHELERSLLAREAAEARLKLLQGQIQPHFIFNTLSALQHWVDTGDPRASDMLHSLTAFLRGSTELLGRETSTLGEEARIVEHYLAIQRARLGERLAFSIDIDPAVAGVTFPPGLLLTLVENAVEHGVAPSLNGGDVRVQARIGDRGHCELCVLNGGMPLASDWHDGVGLANSRERLAQCFGPEATLNLGSGPQGTCAQVLLPWKAAA